MDQLVVKFSSQLPIQVLTRSIGASHADWNPFERGPGYFSISVDFEIQISIKNSNDEDLKLLVHEIKDCSQINSLDLSENRNISDKGLTYLKDTQALQELDLSSCDITNTGIDHLLLLTHIQYLDLRFCHRLTDQGIVKLRKLTSLRHLDLRSLPKITNGSLSKLRRSNLTILH